MQILNPDNTNDRNRWMQLWRASGREPFTHPGYVELFADQDTQARCALYEAVEGRVFYPFLLRRIPEAQQSKPVATPAFDIISPYGYGGPLIVDKQAENGAGSAGKSTPSIQKEQKTALFNGFYREFHHWALDNHIVSEFVRFNLFSEAREQYYGLVEHNNDNVVCDLRLTEEQLWNSFKPKVRSRVRQAMKQGLTLEYDPRGASMNEFLHLYYDTMNRLEAKPFYYFPESFFKTLAVQLEGRYCIFNVRHQGEAISTMMILYSQHTIYSFLSGSLKEYFHLSGNDFLRYHIILWAKQQGYTHYAMGGGHKRRDSVFSFKASFAPKGITPFFTGKMIFDEEVYRELAGTLTVEGFFPAYRKR